ncbi:MAG: hypothetical protein MJ175_08765 [Clostridia bacterium]|nr:hypothetical protein [Clostridia bacterium]
MYLDGMTFIYIGIGGIVITLLTALIASIRLSKKKREIERAVSAEYGLDRRDL